MKLIRSNVPSQQECSIASTKLQRVNVQSPMFHLYSYTEKGTSVSVVFDEGPSGLLYLENSAWNFAYYHQLGNTNAENFGNLVPEVDVSSWSL